MLCLKQRSVKNAYETLVPKILKEGLEMTTEDGQRCKEIMNVMIEITNPKDKSISPKYPLGERAVENYTQQLLYGAKNEFSYDYHSRLFDYPNEDNTKRINQIQYIIDKLKEQPSSRRCVAVTWNPFIDVKVSMQERGSVPCLNHLQIIRRGDHIYMTVLFRSNDILCAFVANAIGLITLGEIIAEETGTELKKYVHIANSAHIYVDRDRDYIKKYFPDCVDCIK
ncbi:thymidylate synthase [Methanotorris igneus]|uniref:Putative thymidylate synthase n=1 Tax=Methanotorris igneus (strain DSM 5666 / JCM 11834 / Kol 5) TaxID=880724 RepID=F6BEZ4_METIK|nr:thymidylate synthase [Methanotorris igneus]AEF95730.1 thymidylate synthase, methanogen type [Methanotorris igneus Kol 5]